MAINRNIKTIGTIFLLAAAALITVSAFRPATSVDLSWPPRPDFSMLVKNSPAGAVSNQEGLAQYYRSERSASAAATNNEAGLAQYNRSERETLSAKVEGLAIYHQSERMQPVKWALMTSKWYLYHQSERHGK